jgi:prepilin-type N-terminal cleavage/methylation domain-containing protein/prepilin-type processing-associated H-X9-DG protein
MRICPVVFAPPQGEARSGVAGGRGARQWPIAASRRQRQATVGAGRGFTLMEMVVVLAILAVLAGLLLPVLVAARGRVYRTVCLSNLQQIGRAHCLYLDDWDERFPYWWHASPPRPRPFGEVIYWTEFLRPYLRHDAILRDPGAVWEGTPADAPILADYTLLTWTQGGHRDDPGEPAMRFPGPPLGLQDVVRPGETMALMDGWTTPRGTEGSARRHGGGVNASFVDGHARWLSTAELWRVDRDERGIYWLHYGSATR